MRVRTGILLINLGSPESPETGDVRRYLREFLSDPLVIDLPAPARWLLLNAVILPFRPRRSAAAYRKIWTPEGSPLRVHGRALRAALGEALGGEYRVELAMRYGTPSIRGALERLAGADVARILVLPLYPQYSAAATGSSLEAFREAARAPHVPPYELLPAFYADPGFIAAWRAVAQPELEAFQPDYVLFSYHGLPLRQVRAAHPERCLTSADCCERVEPDNVNCYRAHCFATTRALAAALELPPESHSLSFQSRLSAAWLEPFTDRVLPELAALGRRRLAVLCPAFVADCLETLEEIAIRGGETFREHGGEHYAAIPCLNDSDPGMRLIETLARRELAGWI